MGSATTRMQQTQQTRGRGRVARLILLAMLMLSVAGCVNAAGTRRVPGGTPVPLPHVDHLVIVVEENHSYDAITGASDTPYLTALRQQGAVFSDAHGVSHPSQPNYLALFAGSTFGLTSDACPQQFTGPNLATALIAHGLRFTGYSESLPEAGSTVCADSSAPDPLYARKHNPWVDFASVPAQSNQPFSSFPRDFSQLPAVAFVVPNQQHDMHSGSVAAGDAWLQHNLAPYEAWAPAHNSLLIVTWDEDDGSGANHILTLFLGAHVKAGTYAETINHYDVLRTVEALEGLPFTNNAAHASTIADVWGG
ncbi:MAG: alkaline phosphatase family protein [Ktedonobacterales bacterium]